MSVSPKCFCMATICLCSAFYSPITETTTMNVFVPRVKRRNGWMDEWMDGGGRMEKEKADYYLKKDVVPVL